MECFFGSEKVRLSHSNEYLTLRFSLLNLTENFPAAEFSESNVKLRKHSRLSTSKPLRQFSCDFQFLLVSNCSQEYLSEP